MFSFQIDSLFECRQATCTSNKSVSIAITNLFLLLYMSNSAIFYFQEKYIPYDDTGQRAYENACKKYKALLSTSFYQKLGESTNIDMRHYNAGPKGGQALAIPLVVSIISYMGVTRDKVPIDL